MARTAEQQKAWDLSARGIVVDIKALTGENVDRKRMDIDQLIVKQPHTFNLFLQALIKVQEDPSIVGWYQLAGIHGWPTALWREVPQRGWELVSKDTWDNNAKTFKDGAGGYCAHGVYIFGTWHRPYLALLEQTLYRTMYTIAESYTDSAVRSRYLEAVQEFRLPYYDYFRPRGGEVTFNLGGGRSKTFPWDFRLPDVFMEPTLTVRFAPDDKPKDGIPNPLYSYRFKDSKSGQLTGLDKAGLAKRTSTDTTLRCPNSRTSTVHNALQLSYNLNANREDECDMLLALMQDQIYTKFTTIASDTQLARGDTGPGDMTSPDRIRGNGSLEGIHNTFHGHIGGDVGHMGTPTVAAFDPVFFFHHCNIDRYFALWQAANPKEWFPKPTKPSESYEGAKPLLPFYRTKEKGEKGTFWTSDQVRLTSALGYTYDDFDSSIKGGIKAGDPESVRSYIASKYQWAARIPSDRSIRNPPKDMEPITDKVRATYFFKPAAATATTTGGGGRSARMAAAPTADFAASAMMTTLTALPPPPVEKIDPVFDREWYVDSKVKRAAANGPFTIYFFLATQGSITTDPSEYSMSPYLAGLHHIFAAPREGCDNCASAEAAGKLSVSTTPITSLLLKYLDEEGNGVETLRPEHIKGFLVKYLRWRVIFQNYDGQDPRNVPDLEIGVSAKVYHDEGGRRTKTTRMWWQRLFGMLVLLLMQARTLSQPHNLARFSLAQPKMAPTAQL
ncbi:hypothetical protein B0H66DRAFT_603970 [Apodospora peruviana]|uniref:tyrosinase n=1 Tax=Apodospora peruviana TaxID=516989 RepID=A0AAE0I6T4_9PEZI|nr:hypothetical protein B0H66DRAFT_603970 [Apodospora peruviana]